MGTLEPVRITSGDDRKHLSRNMPFPSPRSSIEAATNAESIKPILRAVIVILVVAVNELVPGDKEMILLVGVEILIDGAENSPLTVNDPVIVIVRGPSVQTQPERRLTLFPVVLQHTGSALRTGLICSKKITKKIWP